MDMKLFRAGGIDEADRIKDTGFSFDTRGGSTLFLTDEMLDELIAARDAERRAASASYKIYATDADGSERMFGIVSATDVEDAIAKGKKAGYEVTDAVKV